MNLNVKPDTSPKPKNPFALKDGQRGLLLVPYEETARDRTLTLLAAQGFSYENDEERREKGLPKVVFQIKLSRLTSDDVIFSAVPAVAKLGARKQPSEFTLKISKPIEAKKYIMGGEEDGDVNPGAISDALQSAIHPLTSRIGQDSVLKIYPF